MLKTFLSTGFNWLSHSRPITSSILLSRNVTCANTSNTVDQLINRVKHFADRDGRQPRILIAHIDKIGLSTDLMSIASGFADLGFDVDVGPQFLSPEEVARQGVNADVHAVNACNLANGYLISLPALRKELKRLGRPDIIVMASGTIPEEHHSTLHEAGISIVFDHDNDITMCASKALDHLEALLPADDTDDSSSTSPA